jgi:hypothetical protein
MNWLMNSESSSESERDGRGRTSPNWRAKLRRVPTGVEKRWGTALKTTGDAGAEALAVELTLGRDAAGLHGIKETKLDARRGNRSSVETI